MMGEEIDRNLTLGMAERRKTESPPDEEAVAFRQSVARFCPQERQNIDSYRDLQPKLPIFKRP